MASSMSLAYFPTDRRQTQILEICQQLGRDLGRCIAYAVERHWLIIFGGREPHRGWPPPGEVAASPLCEPLSRTRPPQLHLPPAAGATFDAGSATSDRKVLSSSDAVPSSMVSMRLSLTPRPTAMSRTPMPRAWRRPRRRWPPNGHS